MPIRNVQPFYKGFGSEGSNDAGDGTSWPLRPSPYYSRVEDQEIDFVGGTDIDRAHNYQFLGFRPGFSLQASELNEMQEHFQMQLTLTISMYHNWITSGSSSLWNNWDINSPGGEGGLVATGIDTSIGQGGGYNATTGEVFHDSQLAISAPGWKGACPLHPHSSPYQGTANSSKPVTIQYYSQANPAFLRITFWPGWWLTEVRRPWDGNLSTGPGDVSGLKHWVFLDTNSDTGESDPVFVRDVPLSSDQVHVVGLITNSDYYSCCPESEETEIHKCDPGLADNATGIPNAAACGASRYGVYFSRAFHASPDESGNWGPASGNNPLDSENFRNREGMSLVCKVDPVEGTVRYMNNILISKFR